jgi:uncharacterized membrane protein YbhN (UPF0104 family)
LSATATVTNVINPIGDDSRVRRIAKIASLIAAATVVLVVLELAGIDVGGWIAGLWDTLQSVSASYMSAGVALRTAQLALTALAWLFILRAAYPHADVRYAPVLAAYAVGTGLDGVLPASLGTVVMLLMFVAVVPGASFAGVSAAYVVERIFFTVMNALVYVYLFLSVPGSFSVELGGLRSHPWLVTLIVVGVVAVIAVLLHTFWPRIRHFWDEAKQGASILSTPRAYVLRVLLPSLGAYAAKLGTIAVFLAAFAIPVTFGSVMNVVAGTSIANATAATPGGAGVNQAISAVALADYTDAQTATAYSVAQQLVTTAWGVLLALVLLLTVFGWTNGRALVKSSYGEAKRRAADRHRKHGGSAGAPSAEPGSR